MMLDTLEQAAELQKVRWNVFSLVAADWRTPSDRMKLRPRSFAPGAAITSVCGVLEGTGEDHGRRVVAILEPSTARRRDECDDNRLRLSK